MCFNSTEFAKAKKAAVDIICWKVLCSLQLKAPFRRFYYKYGKVMPLVKIKKDCVNDITEGYHSFHTEKRAQYMLSLDYERALYKAIIPAGTRYYTNRQGEYVSEQLMIVRK